MSNIGDGWVSCRCGQRHWGVHGAAGVMLVADGCVLLQQRSAGVHHSNTWSVPGGARHRDETAEQAAIREAVEEVGLDPSPRFDTPAPLLGPLDIRVGRPAFAAKST